MDIKNIILIIVAVFNFLMATVLLLKNWRSPINTTFALVFLGAGMWSLGIAMFMSTLDMEVAVNWARIHYFSSAVIALAFLLFANYYLYKLYELNIIKIFYILLPLFLIIFVIFHPTLLIENVAHYEWGNDANENLLGHLIYAIYFFSYVIWAFIILFKKLKMTEGVNKKSLSLVILCTFLSFLFGMVFNLIMPLIGIYQYIWVGPYFSVITMVFLTYLIFYIPTKNY